MIVVKYYNHYNSDVSKGNSSSHTGLCNRIQSANYTWEQSGYQNFQYD